MNLTKYSSIALAPDSLVRLKEAGLVGRVFQMSESVCPRRKYRNSQITAAAEKYQLLLDALRPQGIRRTVGVLKVICLEHGVNPSSVCTRLKREKCA